MPLDFFVQNKDTGFNYNEAIQPVENGEDANQTTFRRPSENVRTRTEDVRKQFDMLEAVVSSDRGLTVMAQTDAYIEWDHTTGKFTVSDQGSPPASRDIYIVPLLSTAQSPAGPHSPGTHIPATFVYNDTAGGGVFVTEAASDLRDYGDADASRRSGANNLFIEVVESTRPAGSGVAISVSGDEDGSLTFPEDGPVLITIEMEQSGNTAAEIVAALQAAGDHTNYINPDIAKTKVLAAGDCTKEVARIRFADGDVYDAGGGTWYRSMGAVDPEGIEIEGTAIDTFFATAGHELLADGDTLAINFTGAADRLNNQTDSSMADMLVKLSSDASNIDSGHAARRHTIPICKVFGESLYFLNGLVFESGVPGLLVPNPGAMKSDFDAHVAAYDAHVAGTADQHPSSDITSVAHAGSPQSLTASEVDTNLNELLGFYNDHASGSADKHAFTDMASPFRVQIVRNNGWELKHTLWNLSEGGGGGVTLSLGTGAPLHEGTYHLHAAADGVSAGFGYATQISMMPCAPGQTIKISAWAYASTWVSAGFNGVRVAFYDKDLADLGSGTLSFPTGSYGWTEYTGTITAPANTVYVSYVRVEADSDGTTSGELQVDSVSVWIENDSIETAKRLIEHAGVGRLQNLLVGSPLPDDSDNDDFELYFKSGGGGATPVAELKSHAVVNADVDIDSSVLLKPLRDPAKTTAPDHAAGLHKTNVCLAWGVVELDATAPSLVDGYNVASISRDVTGKFDILFHTALASADFCVVFGTESAGSPSPAPHIAEAKGKTTTGFTIYHALWNATTPDFEYHDTGEVYFAVFGRG